MNLRVNWFSLFLALIVGCMVNFLGDWLLDVRIELFWGLRTFNLFWFLELFILPLLVGIVVSYIYGLGGKWIAVFPPLIVRYIAYYQTAYSDAGLPDGAELMPLGWWGFFVILAMESAMIGGVLGEIMNRRIYGWKKAAHVSDGVSAAPAGPASTEAKPKANPDVQKN